MVKNKKNQLEFKKLSEPQFTFFSKIKVKKKNKILKRTSLIEKNPLTSKPTFFVVEIELTNNLFLFFYFSMTLYFF